jgi:hypothetical protein
MRASDADRDKYATVLQDAYAQGRLTRDEYDERLDACMRAKTYGELSPLVADLPAPNLPVVRPSTDMVAPGRPTAPMIAIFSGVERKGIWELADDTVAVAVFGSVEIDLRQAVIPAGENEIRAFAVFGSVEIIVEPGTLIDCSGIGILGDFSGTKNTPPRPDSPAIRVTGVALLGAVTVKEKKRKS